MLQINNLRDNIESSLSKIREFLKRDNGDVELVDISEDGIVKVRLLGSCTECPLSSMTLRAGIERYLLLAHKEIRRVERVR